VPLEELAERGLWTRDGAYRALRRSGLPYLLVGSRLTARRRLHRRIAVSEATARRLLATRAAGSKWRGEWTAADMAELGLERDCEPWRSADPTPVDTPPCGHSSLGEKP
jgi:hypothetical protein